MWVLDNVAKKELILLGLLGISLTTVGATLLYEFYKKENDKGFARRRKSTSQMISTEFKVPNSSVAAVIGKGGRTIKEIEKKTDVTISIQKYSIHAKSDPTYRSCIISGPAESVKLAQIIVQNIIDSVPVIDTCEFYVPYKAVKNILGRHRQHLLEIQEASNTKIVIDDSDLQYKSLNHPANYSYGDPTKHGKKRIVVHGTVQQIEIALDLIKQKVDEEMDGVDAKLEDLCSIKVPGAYTKLATDELDSNGPKILSPLPPDNGVEVNVIGMQTPNEFWVHRVNDSQNKKDTFFDEFLTSEVNYYCEKQIEYSEHILGKIRVGNIVAINSHKYIRWVRAEVTKVLDYFRYEVFLLDHGEFIECKRDDMVELPTDMLRFRPQAIECKLANIKPIKQSKWTQRALEEFLKCVWYDCRGPLNMIVKGYIQRPVDHRRPANKNAVVLCVDLIDEGSERKVNIGQHLVSLGLAEFSDDVHSEVPDDVRSVVKQQFVSAPLLFSKCKKVCLSKPAEEDEDSNQSEESDAESENGEIARWRRWFQGENESELLSILNACRYPKSESKSDDATSVEVEVEVSGIVPEQKTETEISALDANKDETKSESKSDDVIMPVKEHNGIVLEQKTETEIVLDVNKDDAKSEFKPDNVIMPVKKQNGTAPEQYSETEI